MKLEHHDFKALVYGLVSEFGSWQAIELLFEQYIVENQEYGLRKNIHHYTYPRPITSVWLTICRRLEGCGQLDKLIEAAYAARPDLQVFQRDFARLHTRNQLLDSLVAQYGNWRLLEQALGRIGRNVYVLNEVMSVPQSWGPDVPTSREMRRAWHLVLELLTEEETTRLVSQAQAGAPEVSAP